MTICGQKGKKTTEKLEGGKCSCPESRMERFIQPCLLLLLYEYPYSHGYNLLIDLKDFGFGTASDPGALYRNLRRMEEDGLVSSKWETGKSGPAKRVYELTPEGEELLHAWVENIKRNKKNLEHFLRRYKKQF